MVNLRIEFNAWILFFVDGDNLMMNVKNMLIIKEEGMKMNGVFNFDF